MSAGEREKKKSNTDFTDQGQADRNHCCNRLSDLRHVSTGGDQFTLVARVYAHVCGDKDSADSCRKEKLLAYAALCIGGTSKS